MSFSIQSGDQRYEESEQQIRRISRQKAADDKIVAVHREKTLEHGPNREKAGDEGQKKDWKTNMNAETKSPVEKYGDFKQEIPRKQITS